MSKKLALISTVRLGSSRLPEKMVKEFSDGTRMVDLLVDRMEELVNLFPFKHSAIAVHPGELELVNAVIHSTVPMVLRDNKSCKSSKLKDIFNFIRDIPCDNFMWINGSVPFCKPETLARAAKLFSLSKTIKGMTAVVRDKNWFWGPDHYSINVPKTGKTQDSGEIYRSCHAFHIFDKRVLFEQDRYWEFVDQDPHLFEIDEDEAIDVDDEADFELANMVMGGA